MSILWVITVADVNHYRSDMDCFIPMMEKYMKFPMHKKELTDKAYQQNPYRAVNFHIDETGTLRCPNRRAFRFFYHQHVRGTHFGRQEEV